MRCPPLIAAILLLVATLPACYAAAPTTEPAEAGLAAFPVGHWGESLTVPVVWAGKNACFLIDTGCITNCVDPAEFPDLKPVNIDAKLLTAGGSRKARLFSPPDLHIGPISLAEDGPVLAVDLSGVRGVTGEPVIGIIGDRALRKCVLQLDYDSRTLRFLKSDAQPQTGWGHSIAMWPDPLGCPAVHLTIAGGSHSIEIDTGQNIAISLPTDLFDRVQKESSLPVITGPTLTLNGSQPLRQMRIGQFDVADLHYRGLICSETKGAAALGLEFLERHQATLDFPRHRLYLAPGNQFNRPSESDMTGIHAIRKGDQLIAQFVDPGTPAYTAGLRPGDILLSLNGKPASDYSMPEFWSLTTAGDGQPLKITYRHGSTEKTIILTLHRAI